MLKVKVTSNVLLQAHKGGTGVSVFICSLVDTWGRGLFNATPRTLHPGQRDVVHIVREDGSASELLWTATETEKTHTK